MKLAPQVENRAEVVFRWTAKMQRDTRCSDETVAIRIVDWYAANVIAAARTIEFKTTGDPFRCAKTNAQRLMRYRQPDVCTHLPAELEEAWVMGGLIEPYRSNCITELARRYGLLAVPVPDAEQVVGLQTLGALTSEMGQTLQTLGPIFADGCIDADERVHLPSALAELEKLIATAEGLLAQINLAS